MNIPLVAISTLQAGDRLTQEEFLRRWEALPGLKFAELIGGVVYMPSPVSWGHSVPHGDVASWLGVYKAATPGVQVCPEATWIMGPDVLQPDSSLFILPDYGGRVGMGATLLAGAPELAVEVCVTSAAYDLDEKLRLYEREGAQEYLTVLVAENEVRWHHLRGGRLVAMPVPADGIYHSAVFPGLWLDAPALLADDLPRVLTVLAEGTHSDEHRDFVAQLAAQRRP